MVDQAEVVKDQVGRIITRLQIGHKLRVANGEAEVVHPDQRDAIDSETALGVERTKSREATFKMRSHAAKVGHFTRLENRVRRSRQKASDTTGE